MVVQRWWLWVRVVLALVACALLIWAQVLFFGRSSIVLDDYTNYPTVTHRSVACGSVAAYLDTSYAEPGRADETFNPVDAYCANLRAARAGLVGVLAVPTILLLWLSTRRLGPPSRRSVLRAADSANGRELASS